MDIRWKQEGGARQRGPNDRGTPGESSSSSASTPGMTVIRQQLEAHSPIAPEPVQLLGDPQARQLLQHHSDYISASLVWVHGPESTYRDAIISMALENAPLRSSLLALSAADLHSRASLRMQERDEFAMSIERHQSEAMSALSGNMKRLAEEGEDFVTEDPAQASSVLASLFLLMMTSIRLNDDHILRLHMRTADVLVQAWLRAHGPLALSESSLEVVLINCICDMQVWYSLSRSTVSPDKRRCFFSGSANAPLSSIVLAIHTITLHERETSATHQRPTSVELDRLLNELADARLQASHYCESLAAESRSHLEALVEMLYQAGLIYLYRVCLAPDAADSAVALPARRLFEAFGRLPDITLIAQHLVFPLFIAGTESVRKAQKQALVANKMEEVVRISGILDRTRVMAFLRELWDRGQRPGSIRWIDLVKQWDELGEAITIV